MALREMYYMDEENYEIVEFEVDAELAAAAEKVLAPLGYTLEQAIVLFYEETARLGRLPFDIDIDGK